MSDIKRREFTVWVLSDRNTKKKTAFYVTDKFEEESDNDRPRVAEFPISQLYDEMMQRRRAIMLKDYLNRIQEVTEQAIANATLIDALTAPSAPLNP